MDRSRDALRVHAVDRAGFVKSTTGARTPSTSTDDTVSPAMRGALLRTEAAWFLAQETLPRHGAVKRFERDFRRDLDRLIPAVELLASKASKSDVPARVALAAVEEARQRLEMREADGLKGEVDRVKLLARSVMALSHHEDSLSGISMCLLCDGVITDEHSTVPYAYATRLGEPEKSGRVHERCADRFADHP